MAEQHPMYAFVAGELSPDVYGRPDLGKYDLGVALAQNCFVNYRGPLSSRPGTEFVGPVEDASSGFTIQRFRTASDDLLLLFGHNYMRVAQNGGYVVDLAKTVSGYTLASPMVMTITGHTFSAGDMIYLTGLVGEDGLNSRYFTIANPTTNTVELTDMLSGIVDSTSFDAYVSGGNADRIYTLTTTFSGADVSGFNFEQDLEDFIITGSSAGVYTLTFSSVTSWAITLDSFVPTVTAPTNLALTPSATGTAGVAFAITAIIDGEESVPSEYKLHELSVNYTDTAGSMLVEWDAVTNALEYNIYRSLVLPIGSEISLAQEVGFIGRARSPQFTDNNIIADFLKSPPVLYNPFANEQVTFVEITAAGTGYAKTDTVAISGGTGFSGYPVINSAGGIIGVIIVNGGKDYTTPVVSFGTSTGSGATATATVGEASGNQPSAYKKFQQRGVYIGATNFPQTIFAGKPGNRTDMSISTILNAGDGYTFTLDSGEPKGIKHLVALRSGLLLMTDEGVTQLRAEEGRAVSGVNALAEQQIYKGVSNVNPITINNDVLFLQSEGGALNVMVYTAYTQSFELQDISVLSNHLLTSENRGVRMEYIDEPYRLLYIPREDGALITCAYERAQDVFGWSRYTTQGQYRDCVPIKEGTRTTMYYVVERFLHGAWVHTLEREAPRAQVAIEDTWAVDCGLSYAPTDGAVSLQLEETVAGETWKLTAASAVFTSANVGDIVYIHGGKLEITAFTSTTIVTATAHRAPLYPLSERDNTDVALYYAPAAAGKWSMGTPISVLTGLWHLEGKTVSVLADSSAWYDFTVTNGAITLDVAATKIKVGLGFVAIGKTLDLSAREIVVHNKRKKVYSVGVRMQNSRGVEVGDDTTRMFEYKEETDFVQWGDPNPAVNGTAEITINHGWKRDSAIYFRQRYPLPMSLLGFVENYDVGDI